MNASTTRTTLQSTNERIDSLESKLDLILGVLKPAGEPVKAVKPAKAKKVKASKASNKASKPVVEETSVRCLVQANRKQFIADHDWAQAGTSTRRLAEQVLLEEQPLTGNWMIGPKRAAMVLGVEESDLTTDTPLSTEVVVAEVKAGKPAKRSKAQRKAAKKIAASPRRADGTITPKCEWVLREDLAETGKYDRHEIDTLVAEAYENEALVEHYGLV